MSLATLSPLLDLSGISTSFLVLSPAEGLITHVLRTRAPLSTPKGFSFDLHVLGPPQTFALSQDQTLQFDFLLFASLTQSSVLPFGIGPGHSRVPTE